MSNNQSPYESPTDHDNTSISRKRYFAFSSISVVTGLIIGVAILEVVLGIYTRHIGNSEEMDPGLIRYHSQLGWELVPGWNGRHHHFDYDVEYSIDEYGFRQQQHEKSQARNTIVLGDSFTFGLGVDDAETFVYLLNEENEDEHFWNLGVPGYSTDQQVLQLRSRAHHYSPDHILLVVYIANDLFDNTLPRPMQAAHAKPFFQLDHAGRLLLKNNPVPLESATPAASGRSLASIVMGEDYADQSSLPARLSSLNISKYLGLFQDSTVIPTHDFDDRFSGYIKLFMAIIHDLKSLTEQNEAELTIALLPGASYIHSHGSTSAQYQQYLLDTLNDRLGSLGDVELIDIARGLREASVLDPGLASDWYHPNEGHLTPVGHRYVADYLLRHLHQ